MKLARTGPGIAFASAVVFTLLTLGGSISPLRGAPQVPSVAASMPFGGLERTYRVYRPESLRRDVPVPMVVVLHGGYGTGAGAEAAYHWDAAADAGGFVVVYPDGFARAWNAGTCCGRPQRDNTDDVGFLSALIAQLSREQNIDLRRIYMTGICRTAR